METPLLRIRHSKSQSSGFSVMETMISIVILTVGLLSLAALMAKTTTTTHLSRYMGTAALLASEKMEDLNRLPLCSPGIEVNSGKTTEGSLTSDSSDTVVTPCGETEDVSYFDQVSISAGNGAVTETSTGTDGSGNTVYNTFSYTADGQVQADQAASAPAQPESDTVTFNRRWIVESNAPVGPGGAAVSGVNRVTVLVWANNIPGGTPVRYQASMVRQVQQ